MNKVSAIIVNWNDKITTAECINSLLKQDYSNLEIIVSDNGSTDGSQGYFKKNFPQVILIENEVNLGFGAAVNRGFDIAQGEYFIFLNNDLVLKPDSIRHLVNFLERDPSIGAVIPKILFCEYPNKINSYGVNIHFTGMAYPNMLEEQDSEDLKAQPSACGGIFIFRRSLFNIIGGFDEELFLYHEDHDLSWRIRLNGYQLMVCPDAVFYHHYKFNKGLSKFYYSEKNRLHILIKNFQTKTLLLITPALIIIELAQWFHALTHGWLQLKIKSYYELIKSFPQILTKRKSLQKKRKVSDKEIIELYKDNLQLSGIKSPLLEKILSPALGTYWSFVKNWI